MFFSIVVPVYNVERYIEECINSIIEQDFDDYELILVDDGSTDRSGIICDNYSFNYPQIRCLHQSNGGLSDARNKGTELACGKYVIYVDSDDMIVDRHFLGNAVKIISRSKHSPDLVLFGFRKIYDDNSYREYRVPFKAFLKEATVNSLCKNDCYQLSAWGKIIKRRILEENRIKFRLGVLSEDIDWCAKVLIYCNCGIVWNCTAYGYRQRMGSISKRVSVKHLDDIENGINICIDLEEECDGTYNAEALRIYISKIVSMYYIVVSRQKKSEWRSRRQYAISRLDYLKNSKRLRERLIYIAVRTIGFYGVMNLLGVYDKRKHNYGNGANN